MVDQVTLAVGRQAFEGWKTAAIVRSIDELAGAFEFVVSEKYPDRPSARELLQALREADQEVEVRIGEDIVISGYLDTLAIETGAQGTAVTIQGRDATGDLVDCAPDIKPGEWKHITLLRLAEILCEPFGIKVRAEVDVGPAFPKIALSPGETAWDLLEEVASYRGVIAMSDGLGGLVLTEAGKAGRGDALVHGQNLLASTFVRSEVDRFSEYIARGQKAGTDQSYGVSAASAEGRAFDEAIRRNRPMVIIVGSSADAGRCQKRAAFEATVRAGRAERVSATLAGWRQSNGDLWVPNLLCSFDSDPLDVNAQLVVAQVTLEQDENSTKTTLDLVRPDAFAPLGDQTKVKRSKDSEFDFSPDE